MSIKHRPARRDGLRAAPAPHAKPNRYDRLSATPAFLDVGVWYADVLASAKLRPLWGRMVHVHGWDPDDLEQEVVCRMIEKQNSPGSAYDPRRLDQDGQPVTVGAYLKMTTGSILARLKEAEETDGRGGNDGRSGVTVPLDAEAYHLADEDGDAVDELQVVEAVVAEIRTVDEPVARDLLAGLRVPKVAIAHGLRLEEVKAVREDVRLSLRARGTDDDGDGPLTVSTPGGRP